MKKKIYKICGVALALVLVFSLFGAFLPARQVEADPGEVAWSTIANPGGTLRTGLNLADVDVGPIAVSPDGETIFAAVFCETAIPGVSTTATAVTDEWALLQSTDGGHNWTATGLINNPGPISGIAISPYFPTDGTMYVAAGSVPLSPAPAVFRSNDSGATFTELKGVPDDAGTNTTTVINSIAMWPASPYPYVMVGTNTDVWVLQDMPFGTWMDQEVGNPVRVEAVAFAPDFAATNFIWAVTRSGVLTCTNSPGAWGTIMGHGGVLSLPDVGDTIKLTAGAAGAVLTFVISNGAAPPAIVVGAGTIVGSTITLPAVNDEVDFVATAINTTLGFLVTAGSVTATIPTDTDTDAGCGVGSADIAFPDDYDSSTAPYAWVSTDSTGFGNAGGVFRVRGLAGTSQSIQQLFDLDIRSIATSGSMASATILAGEELAPTIWQSTNGGLTWPGTAVLKQPTGATRTYVEMAPDFAASSLAYVSTTGAQSAFQVTRNTGTSWNQTGLVDVPLVVAASALSSIDDIAVVSQDTVFMVANTTDLWKTIDATATAPIWERILTNTTVTMPMHALTTNITLVANSPEFATDSVVYATDSGTAVVKSTDGGDIFAPMGTPGATITALYVVDAIFAFTGAAGQVYRTDDGAYSWLAATIAPGTNPIVSIAISPDYANDGTMLVGNNIGVVYISTNSGATFAMEGAAIGTVTDTYVAFDPEYADNSTIYAGGSAGTGGQAGIFRWVVGVSTAWTEIPAVAAAQADVIGLDVSPDGTLYATDVGAAIGTITEEPIQAVVTINFADGATTPDGAPEQYTLDYTNQAGAAATTAVNSIPITATIGTVFPITLAATDTGARDILTTGGTATGPVSDGTGQIQIVGTVTGNVYGTLTFTGTVGGTYIDSTTPTWPFTVTTAVGSDIERSLNPRNAPPLPAPTFEPMDEQLAVVAAGAVLNGLWLVVDPALDVIGSKNVLFSIDTFNDQIVTYTDTLATTIVLAEPADGTIFPRETAVTMAWEELTGADTYHWQICTDAAFRLTPVDEGYTGYTSDSSGVLAAGRTYYWRVRVEDATGVGDPLFSRWSNAPAYESAAHWSFTTFLGERPWHPFVPMSGVSPSPGATDIPLKPTFQWNGADWATTYDLELADNAAFTGATKKTLSTTAWTCDPALDYNTTYYWKVKAVSDVTESEWSDVGVFTTVAEVIPPAKVYTCPQDGLEFSTEAALQAHWDKFHAPKPPVKPTTPAYIWAIIGVGALLVIAVLVLIIRTRRVGP